MYTVKALRISYTPSLTLIRMFQLKNFCYKNLLTIMITSRNGYNNNDYNTHMYEKKQIGYSIHFEEGG